MKWIYHAVFDMVSPKLKRRKLLKNLNKQKLMNKRGKKIKPKKDNITKIKAKNSKAKS